MKNRHYILPVLLLLVILGSSCSEAQGEKLFSGLVKAPAASIERDVRGHEMIASVQANLYYARKTNVLVEKGSNKKAYKAYTIGNRATPIPMLQTIEIKKNDGGAFVIDSERKAFDVIKGKELYYFLELKYYDVNGQLINHQFSHYDAEDKDASTLEQHQTMFSLHTHSLDNSQLTYPMTLDSVYYDAFLFGEGKRTRASLTTPKAVLAKKDASPGTIRYSHKLADEAIEKTMSIDAGKPFTDPETGEEYYLYRTLTNEELNNKVQEIFEYEYRDTDPVENPLFKKILADDMNRNRLGKNVQFLKQRREVGVVGAPDYLGFKGLVTFNKANVAFQMRVAMCHIIEAGQCKDARKACGKYVGSITAPFRPLQAHQIPASWNTYDIDYPLPFRVIADIDGDKAQFLQDIQKYYPEATEAGLRKMFASHYDGTEPWESEVESNYYRRIPFVWF